MQPQPHGDKIKILRANRPKAAALHGQNHGNPTNMAAQKEYAPRWKETATKTLSLFRSIILNSRIILCNLAPNLLNALKRHANALKWEIQEN